MCCSLSQSMEITTFADIFTVYNPHILAQAGHQFSFLNTAKLLPKYVHMINCAIWHEHDLHTQFATAPVLNGLMGSLALSPIIWNSRPL